MIVHDLDCRSSAMPAGIVVDEVAGKGLGLRATVPFVCGARLYRYKMTLHAPKEFFRVQTDSGTVVVSPPSNGSGRLTPDLVLGLPDAALAHFVEVLGVEKTLPRAISAHQICAKLTDNGAKTYMFSGFDCFMNHGDKPSCCYSFDDAELGREDGIYAISLSVFALRDIEAGEELTVDYATFYTGFVRPRDWMP